MARVIAGYFLEDIAQEGLIKAIVSKVATQSDYDTQAIEHAVRTSAGGAGVVRSEIRRFLRDYNRGLIGPFDILVIARDSNCRGYNQVKAELQQLVQGLQYPGPVAYAIPEPHIERWYLLDPEGFRRAVGVAGQPRVPQASCQRGLYKNALAQAFGNINPPLGGVEWAEEIVGEMDFYTAGQADSTFRHFITDLRDCIASYR